MKPRFMIDTDIASFLIRGTNPSLNSRVVSHAGTLCMSAITFHELMHGAGMRNSQRLFKAISALAELVPVTEFTKTASAMAAKIRVTLDGAGKTIGVMDALIAGNALAEHCVLVTNNTAHFSRVEGLEIENWASAEL